MTESCPNTDKFSLTYQIGGKKEVVQSKIRPRFRPITKGTIAVGNIGEKLDYEITEDTLKRSYLATGTFTNLASQERGETKHYVHFYYAEEQRDSYEILEYGGYWLARAQLNQAVTGGDPSRSGNVRMISQESYDSLLAEETLFPRPTYTNSNPSPKIHALLNYNNEYSFPGTDRLDAPTIITVGCPSYNVRVFSETRELINQPIANFTNGTTCDPEAQYVHKYEVDAIQTLSKEFTKEFATQLVEVSQVPNSPYKKVLWLVDVDQDGEETGRTNVFEFELLPEQGVPYHEVKCLSATIAECPRNTCKVDCDAHYCCYDKKGESIHSFLKSEE